MQDESHPGQLLAWPEPDPLQAPPAKTGAEEKFYKRHMLQRTPMVVVTTTGGKFVGWLEWYDREVIKLHSYTDTNRFIAKSRIKYMYRHEEDPDFVTRIPTPPPLVPSDRSKPPRRRRK